MSGAFRAERVDQLCELLSERELDLLLVNDLHNVRYLTGYSGSNGIALVGPDVRVFLTDFRYKEQAAAEVHGFDVTLASQDLIEALVTHLPATRPLALGFDDVSLSVRQHRRLADKLTDVTLTPAGGLVESLRMVKDAEEIDRIAASAALLDECFAWLAEQPIIGRAEREIAGELEFQMRKRGAQAPSFPSIVAAAEHSALPHASPRDVPIPPNTLLTVDAGAVLDGYCSDSTRTFATGELDGRMREVYDTVLKAQLCGLESVKPGVPGVEVDTHARSCIDDAGFADYFGHGLGHGVGLNVHEGPRLSQRSSDMLQEGNVVTVEPGIYLPGEFGVRIEDLLVVTDIGHRLLSHYPKELTTLA